MIVFFSRFGRSLTLQQCRDYFGAARCCFVEPVEDVLLPKTEGVENAYPTNGREALLAAEQSESARHRFLFGVSDLYA